MDSKDILLEIYQLVQSKACDNEFLGMSTIFLGSLLYAYLKNDIGKDVYDLYLKLIVDCYAKFAKIEKEK